MEYLWNFECVAIFITRSGRETPQLETKKDIVLILDHSADVLGAPEDTYIAKNDRRRL